jgi:hypothetical protein
MIAVSVGDHSPSNSELWLMNLGPIRHKAAGVGVVTPGVYTLPRGSYDVSIEWLDGDGDYDYTATVEIVDACGIVSDPDELFGVWMDDNDNHQDRTIGKQAQLRLPKVDLDIDSANDGDIDDDDSIEMDLPGRDLSQNYDDDNEDEVPDLNQAPVQTEDDLLRANLSWSAIQQGTLRLFGGGNRIKVWKDASKNEQVALPASWDLETDTPPQFVFLEGVLSSSVLGDAVLALEYDGEGMTCSDTVRLTVIPAVFTIKVTAWIPWDHISNPGVTATIFEGDGPPHFSPSVPDPDRIRFKQAQWIDVVPSAALAPTPNGVVPGTDSSAFPTNMTVGMTRLYDRQTSLTDPPEPRYLLAEAANDWTWDWPMALQWERATPAANTITVTRLNPAAVYVYMRMGTGNPLVPLSPAIDWEVEVVLDVTNPLRPLCTVTGQRDGFPAHDIFINESLIDYHDPRVTGDDAFSLFPGMERPINVQTTVPY